MNSALANRLLERIRLRQANVGVVGLGYVGLPLAVEFARGGLNAVGLDLDARKIAALEGGHSYIPDVPSSDIASLVSAGRLRATTDFAVVEDLVTPAQHTGDIRANLYVVLAYGLRSQHRVVTEHVPYIEFGNSNTLCNFSNNCV